MIEKIKNWGYQFLIKTRKYTGTDNIYLAIGASWLTLGRVISAIASFLLAIAFANLLDPATYGSYRYVLSLVGILGIFTLPGMEIAVTQAVARNLEGSFYSGFKTKLKWGLLGSLVAIGGATYYWSRGNSVLPIPLLILAIFLPLMAASQVYKSFLAGRKLFNVQVKYNAIVQVISTGALIGTLFLTKNLFWLIAVYFVSETLLNYSFYLISQRKFKPNREEDPQTISYGKHLTLIEAIGQVMASKLDQFLLFTLIGSASLAVYYFALMIPDQIRNIGKIISTLTLSKFSNRSSQEIKKNMNQKMWKLFILAGIIITLYVIAAPFIYNTFFPQYSDSVIYSQIYIFSLLTLPTSLIITAFRAKAKKKKLYILKIMPFLQIILLLGLVPLLGIMGAILALVGTKILSIGLVLILFRKF
ncbi:MAG: oligosaccharide flippase family protein [Patescibacteria group bacterium]|nr:oligosaccharide flippase family protein [Patescibacteria group bacterium]